MSRDNDPQEVQAALAQALARHQRGELDVARAAYERILARDPDHPDAGHLLGVIERQQGQPAAAAARIARAIAARPGQATMHCNLGAALQDLERVDEALASYDAALALQPRYPLAWSNRGNTLRKLGRHAEALDSYAQALALQARYPEAHCHRALTLHDLGRDGEALEAAQQALAQRPHYVDALCAQGHALHGLGRYDAAAACFDEALAHAPAHPQAGAWRGIALHKAGRLEEAVASYSAASRLQPARADLHHYLGNALRALGRDDAALAAWRQALALGAPPDAIAFAIAALTAGAADGGAPRAYVRALFDDYAARFDDHLVARLDYRTPALIEAALARLLPDAAPGAVLDLGCGTGLCAPALRARAQRLVGVDLSEKMLDKARARGLYDALDCADIGTWLEAQDARFDLAVAADVLVYFGALDGLFLQVARVLRAGGCFICSIEGGAGTGFRLQPSARYAHSLAYVAQCAGAAGLTLAEASPAVLRHDGGAPVDGQIVVLRRP